MKIYASRIPAIAGAIAKNLIDSNAVEVEDGNREEFCLDIESVLRSYVDTERRIHEEAQAIMTKRGADFSSVYRIKSELAKKYNFGLAEDAVDWITDQIIEILYHTDHVEEIWVENNVIRRVSRDILLSMTNEDDALDVEVRKKIKNLSEGSVAWDVRYQQIMAELKRKKGLN